MQTKPKNYIILIYMLDTIAQWTN